MKGKTVSVSFMLLGILFCVCLISANLLATKQIMFGPFNITAGILVFPISYIVNDCIVEVWGFNKAKLLIWTGFAMNFLFVAFGFVADLIPGAPYWDNAEGFHKLFGLAPRVAAASFLAFLCGSTLNSWVMSRMKVSSKGRAFGARAILSSVTGELLDSCIFFPIVFWGIMSPESIIGMVFTQVVVKTLYELVVLPVTTLCVRYLKRKEQTDVYDENISYNPFRIGDL